MGELLSTLGDGDVELNRPPPQVSPLGGFRVPSLLRSITHWSQKLGILQFPHHFLPMTEPYWSKMRLSPNHSFISLLATFIALVQGPSSPPGSSPSPSSLQHPYLLKNLSHPGELHVDFSPLHMVRSELWVIQEQGLYHGYHLWACSTVPGPWQLLKISVESKYM